MDFLSKLDPGQRQAVLSRRQNILCLAGAGSGKTRVLITRIVYLIKKRRVNPDEILAITFTRNAAKEMLNRLAEYGVNPDKICCRTFHSLGYKILQERDPNFSFNILNTRRQEKILKESLDYLMRNSRFYFLFHQFRQYYNWPIYLFLEETLKIISLAKNHNIAPREIFGKISKNSGEEVKNFFRLVLPVFARYQAVLDRLGLRDFEDLLLDVIALFERKRAILNQYRQKFRYILVDEYQDVNHTQVKLLKLLKTARNNIFCVGDDWQSIYAFRGSEVKYILNFKKTFAGNSQEIILPYNYRSLPAIVKAGNRVIACNRHRSRKKIKAFQRGNLKARIFRAKNFGDEEAFIKKQVRAILKTQKRDPESVMVLGRTWQILEPYKKLFPRKLVKISTIHGAKGLEADIVFILGLFKGRMGFPDVREDSEIISIIKKTRLGEYLEEERRLFYVALTRAKKQLFLITKQDRESRFLREVPFWLKQKAKI